MKVDRRAVHLIAGLLFSVLLGGVAGSGAQAAELTDEAKAALEKEFPGARIRDVEMEREFGVQYFEAELRVNRQRVEVEVSPDGIIGEIERVVKLDDLPEETRKAIAERFEGKTIRRIEQHERRGSARSGTWVPLSAPTLFYDVKYSDGRRRSSMILDREGHPARDRDDDEDGDDEEDEEDDAEETEEPVAVKDLPEAVTKTIQARFKGARIRSATKGTEGGKQMYEVLFTQGKMEMEAEVDAEGIISEVTEELSARDLPREVQTTLRKTYPRAKVKEAERIMEDGKTIYEVELRAGKEIIEVELDAAGNVLHHSVESAAYEDD